jgi:hypothetical protein
MNKLNGWWFDKEGKPINEIEVNRLLKDSNYKIIKQEWVTNDIWVSTVWLGLNHSYIPGKLLIFETMAFKKVKPKKIIGMVLDKEDIDCERYATEEEAKAGHIKMVNKYKKCLT